MWARFAGGTAQEELQGIAVNADPGLAEAVRQDKLGVGYNNIGFAYDIATGAPVAGLRVIPIDLNGNGAIDADEDFYAAKDDIVAGIKRRAYPFPPARELYLVTKGEASPTIKAFYRWILTDGQQYVPVAGYVPLTAGADRGGAGGVGIDQANRRDWRTGTRCGMNSEHEQEAMQ
jgi:phosphate transport system substrate-binding protein